MNLRISGMHLSTPSIAANLVNSLPGFVALEVMLMQTAAGVMAFGGFAVGK